MSECNRMFDYECWYPADWHVGGTWWARGWCDLPTGHEGAHHPKPDLDDLGMPTGQQIER